MIGYLKGKIVFKDVSQITLNVRGVGYDVNYFASDEINSVIELFIVHKLSEYNQVLYGFKTAEEKKLFIEFSSIPGVGPKTAFQIMHELKIKSFVQMLDLKIDQLIKVNGVGKSIAQKILFGINTKMKKNFDMSTVNGNILQENSVIEAMDAVKMLGFTKKDAKKIILKYSDEIRGKSTDQIVKFLILNIK
jgi:Holliday junction DNA helicase RuvA